MKAQSKSAGKPKLGDIWKWLDQGFLLEMAQQMEYPVEKLGKYPRNNWKNGIADKEFISARIESAVRHLYKLKDALDSDETNSLAKIRQSAHDDETGQHETACVAVNMMMVFYCLHGELDI